MGDMVDLDTMVEASWRTFQQDYAATLGQLRAGEYLLASVLDSVDALGVVPTVLAFPGLDEIRLVVPGNDVLSCAYRLTRSELSTLRKLGLRRDERHSAAYRMALPSGREDEAASVATAVIRDVFSVRHPAFLEGGGFSVGCSRFAEDFASGDAPQGVYPEGPEHLDHLMVEALLPVGDLLPTFGEVGSFRLTDGPATVLIHSFACAPTIYAYATLVRSIADRSSAQRLAVRLNHLHPHLGFQVDGDCIIVGAEMDALPFDALALRRVVLHILDVVLEHGPGLAARLGGLAFSE